MNVNNLLLSYLYKQYGTTEEVVDFAKKYSLYFQLSHLLNIDTENHVLYKMNKLRYDAILKYFIEIQNCFHLSGISVLVFKGIVLANRLYDNVQDRSVGDIDIFVNKTDFSDALTLLIRLGYNFCNKKTFYDEHHITLYKDNIVIELHKNIFNPILGINENYILKHIEPFRISEYTIETFDISATLLHLIYHLYQDAYWSYHSLHSVLTNQKIPKIKRFLYRAYEIALFSEKYYDEINWDDIIKNLMHQKLRIFFKKMIYDIVDIFPKTFPNKYLQVINTMGYVDNEHDVWCKRLLESEYPQENINHVLSNFIDDYWEKRSSCNIYINAGGSISLNNPYIKDVGDDEVCELACNVLTEKIGEDFILTFEVSNDDFCFTGKDEFDTSASDGIHLMLYGTEIYSYNSIYIFPKIENGKAYAIPVDVKRGRKEVIDTSLVSTDCRYTDNDYTVTVTLTKEFLQKNSLTNYLYMGLVIVDCSSKTKNRKAELVLSDTYSEWYNPTYFAKIDIDD